MQTSQTTMFKSWGFHVAIELKINLNRLNPHMRSTYNPE
jgi:hypothetical protein